MVLQWVMLLLVIDNVFLLLVLLAFELVLLFLFWDHVGGHTFSPSFPRHRGYYIDALMHGSCAIDPARVRSSRKNFSFGAYQVVRSHSICTNAEFGTPLGPSWAQIRLECVAHNMAQKNKEMPNAKTTNITKMKTIKNI